jgi:hypothetical protein
MAMAFNYRVLENAARNYILQVEGVDTAATTAYTQDGSATGIIAANGYTPTVHLKVRRIVYNTTNCMARLQWHATANTELINLSGYGTYCIRDTQGIFNDNGTGATGDIDLFSIAIATASGTVTAAMSLVIECIKGV